PQRLDRSNDGQDHTVLPYACSLTATGFDDIVHVAIEMLARRTNSAARRHEASGSRRAIRPAHASRTRTLPRPPQARLTKNDDTRSPLKVEPGWATHTAKPNFGKEEYICAGRLTEG